MSVNSTFDGITYIVAAGEMFCSNTLINNARATVRSGAVVTADRLSAGGNEDVFSGGITSSAIILSGGKVLLAGGTALDTQVSSGGTLCVRSYSGNLSYASRAQIYSGGFMDVYNSASAQGTVIHEGGYVRVRDYGSALDTVIESGAKMYVHSSCGYASNTAISGFGKVYDGGLMSDTTIASGGSFHVYNGGILKDIEVQSGGLLEAGQSAVLSGAVLVAGQLKASYDQNIKASGAKITVDLSSRTVSDDYCIINLDYLGDTTLAISVSANQTAGSYKIASNAAEWNETISLTVQGRSKESFSLNFNTCQTLNEKEYALTKENGNLLLTISSAAVPDPYGLSGSSGGLSWHGSSSQGYIVSLKMNDDKHILNFTTGQTAVDLYALKSEVYDWQVGNAHSEARISGKAIAVTDHIFPAELISDADGYGDVFFGNADGTWECQYAAQHVGSINDWNGTNECVELVGKNKIADTFTGSSDANILFLTDDDNGDALFVDDIYTAFPAEHQSRIAQIDQIRAGAGDDVVDLTSQRYEYIGNGVLVHGGSGNDTIWTNKGSNQLFGDAGNDRIIGASGNDVLQAVPEMILCMAVAEMIFSVSAIIGVKIL